jgi:hypothetical protein
VVDLAAINPATGCRSLSLPRPVQKLLIEPIGQLLPEQYHHDWVVPETLFDGDFAPNPTCGELLDEDL